MTAEQTIKSFNGLRMNEKDFADLIRLARRSPLSNMDEAEAAAALLQRFAAFASKELERKAKRKRKK